MDFDGTRRTDLHYQVTELQTEYTRLIDDDRLEEWTNLFTEDCTYKVIPRENADRNLPIATIFCDSRDMLLDRIISLRKANIYPTHHYRHILSNVRILAMEAQGIRAETSYLVLQTRNDGDTAVYNTGRYLDEIVFSEGMLRFRSKIAVFDTNRVNTLMVKPI
jgi:anthranilate 1,2-dioxygenase small subunit